jgi:hypothetical protein
LENGFADFVCNREFLGEHYTSLYFIGLSISKMDEDSLLFVNLKFLKLNNNNITVLENVPPMCTDLYLYNNQLKHIKLPRPTKLMFLGVGNNQLTDEHIEPIGKGCP